MPAAAPLALIEQKAVELVRRARAGDQNAMGMIKQIGGAARQKPSAAITPKDRDRIARARAAFAAIRRYIETHPATAAAAGLFGADSRLAAAPKRDPELAKPMLPKGIFDALFDPERFEIIVVRACKYRHGLPAAAVVLASGPPLVMETVNEIGLSTFGSDARTACFIHGVRFCGEQDWAKAAPSLDGPQRRALVVGQCVGRARRLQMLRQPNSQIGRYAPSIGWELGE